MALYNFGNFRLAHDIVVLSRGIQRVKCSGSGNGFVGLGFMIDGIGRKALDPFLDAVGRFAVRSGISANAMTLTGFLAGMGAAMSIWQQAYLTGAALIILSRLCDGLDGVVARANGATDFGGYLDIVLDFAFYGMIPLAFAAADPLANALPAAILLFSFYFNGASFLAYAILAAKRDQQTEARGKKSIFFTTGLAEAGETLAMFLVACFWPGWFPIFASVFAGLCVWTAVVRIFDAQVRFR